MNQTEQTLKIGSRVRHTSNPNKGIGEIVGIDAKPPILYHVQFPTCKGHFWEIELEPVEEDVYESRN
jgi:hypothetical protein